MISLRTADSALKNVYLDVIKHQLNNEVDPFYSKIVQTEQDVYGNEVKKLVAIGVSGGIGAGDEDGNLPNARGTNYVNLTTTLKNLYGQLEISDKAIKASQSESGAFLNLLNAEMDNLIESSKFNLRRMLYGFGDGRLSATTSVTAGSSVYKVNNPNLFMIGMRVRALSDFGDPVSYIENVEVLDIDYENSTITLPSTAAYVEDEDCEAPFMFYSANAVGDEFIGLSGINNYQEFPTLYGLNRGAMINTFLNTTQKTITEANFNLVNVLKFVDDMKINFNASTDIIATGYIWKSAYQKALKTYALNTDIVSLQGGIKSLSLNGIPVYATRFLNPKFGFFVDSSTFKIHQLCDWTWLTNDKGEILHQKEGYAVHSATLVKYCDLICEKPCKNGLLVLN